MFMYTILYQVDNFDSLELVNYGIIQIRECALNWFMMKLVHKRMLDICRLSWSRATYLVHVDSYVQMIPTLFEICMTHTRMTEAHNNNIH